MKIDLIWFGNAAPQWSLGQVWTVEETPSAVHSLVQKQLNMTDADAWLFWHSSLGVPDAPKIESLMSLPGNVWHAGLKLGLGHLPRAQDFLEPTWMLNSNPDTALEASSWRMSLKACLISLDVIRQMGFIQPTFQSLEAAALETGHRYILRGVIMRHVPSMIKDAGLPAAPSKLALEDEVRFTYYRSSKGHTYWMLMRVVLSFFASPFAAWGAWQKVKNEPRPPVKLIFKHPININDGTPVSGNVTVLIPTIDRYPYIRTLLKQLREQTVKPHEIIIVDQTKPDRRDFSIAEEFKDLPLTVIYQDEPGQCTSRNQGIQQSTGDYILFIDDDDEVQPDLLEKHLRNLMLFKVDVSSGSQDEVGAGPVPESFSYIRVSDVFPTNNTMIRREVLYRSGLFDLLYNRRKRADGDLGTRIYLSGTLMIYNPEISVFHHHAPSGGLRVHKARVITYASSRQRLFHRNLPSVSEIYLGKRYFTSKQVNEGIWQRIFATYSIRGSLTRKLMKAVVSTILLPNSLWLIWKNYHQATDLLNEYPQIPQLGK